MTREATQNVIAIVAACGSKVIVARSRGSIGQSMGQ
jgi:hypothetical protein